MKLLGRARLGATTTTPDCPVMIGTAPDGIALPDGIMVTGTSLVAPGKTPEGIKLPIVCVVVAPPAIEVRTLVGRALLAASLKAMSTLLLVVSGSCSFLR